MIYSPDNMTMKDQNGNIFKLSDKIWSYDTNKRMQ